MNKIQIGQSAAKAKYLLETKLCKVQRLEQLLVEIKLSRNGLHLKRWRYSLICLEINSSSQKNTYKLTTYMEYKCNVRGLFNTLERSLAKMAKYQVME